MNLPVAQEARIFKPGNQAQHACLLAKLQVILKSDQVVGIGAQIFLAQLHHRIRNASGARIFQSDRLHGAEAQRVAAAPRDLFDRQAALEVVQLLPVAFFDRLRRDQRIVEAVVLFSRHRAVDVVGRAFVVACRQIHLRHVDGIGFDDGADRIVEEQVRSPAQSPNFPRKRVRGQRAGGNDRDLIFVNLRNFFATYRDQRLARNSFGHPAANVARSTASACPAGTAQSRAISSSNDPARRISSFSSQGAVFSLSDFREFEQTSSAKSAV